MADLAAEGVRKSVQAAVYKGEADVRGLTKISTAAIVAEPDRAFVESKATPQPVGTYLQQIKVSGGAPEGIEEDVHPPPQISAARL